jgi:hypothetical protein
MNIDTEVKILGLNTIQVALQKANAPYGAISKAGIRMVGHAANVGREILAKQFTTSSGPSSLHYNNMYWRKMMGKAPLASNKAGYYDRRGDKHRLIHYSLKGRFGVKSAHLSSYPMNLWERRKDGRSKWIMTVKLAPLVAAQAPRFVDKAERELEADMERLMRGGN